jgi:hypothetical protein
MAFEFAGSRLCREGKEGRRGEDEGGLFAEDGMVGKADRIWREGYGGCCNGCIFMLRCIAL